MRTGLVVVFALLLPLLTPLIEVASAQPLNGGSDPGVSDTPTWRIGDRWIYSGVFDPTILITDSGVQASVGEIRGDTTTTVKAIRQQIVDNVSTIVYDLQAVADFDKDGVELDGYTGNVEIQYTLDEVIRASDMATISSDLSLFVRFIPYGLSSLTRDIADITISTTYAPAKEDYDFPLRDGETWTSNYFSTSSWSGASDYITPFPAPTSGQNHSNWEVTAIGRPIDDYNQQIAYSGCEASYELRSYADDGTEESFKWYCPEVNNYAWTHTEEDIGLVIDFRLKQYIPVSSSGVTPSSDPGTRNNLVEVELSAPVTALNVAMEVWVNLTDSSGSPRTGVDVQLRHEIGEQISNGVTANNGTAWFIVNLGDYLDASPTLIDYASHGIIAIENGRMGVASITLDENVVALDLVAAIERVNIARNRSGVITNLNAISGYMALPGDILDVELSVYNRGISTSSATQVRIDLPDGNSSDYNLNPLSLFQEQTFTVQWIVPLDAVISNSSLSWEADPNGINSGDADSGNDLAMINIFIGTLPTIVFSQTSGKTLEAISLDAQNTFDEDGGEVSCIFRIEYDDGSRSRANEKIIADNCAIEYEWIDDGDYIVNLTVIDDEADLVSDEFVVVIANRAPVIQLQSARTEVRVEHMVTVEAFAFDIDSEDDWPGIVDVYWPESNCLEGYYTRRCTTTSPFEGLQTITAYGSDDDGEITTTSIEIDFTNIAPHDMAITMWENGGIIIPDGQLTWHIDEDQEVELIARAEDSRDDVYDLHYSWDLGHEENGRESKLMQTWNESGLHKFTVLSTDSEGADSGVIERWVNVRNVVPTITPLLDNLPVAEGQSITLIGNASDTSSDRDSLQMCWDVDPGVDSDLVGSADDDCDVNGSTLQWSWDVAGNHTVVFHVSDDDGARNSTSTAIRVLNIPPTIRITSLENVIAGNPIWLSANGTTDSTTDIEGLMVIWDLDSTTDSNGDGIANNDPDLIGKAVEYTFPIAGIYTITVIAWDEDAEYPASKQFQLQVLSPDRTIFEEVVNGVAGDQANPTVQFMLIALVILGVLFAVRRLNQRSDDSLWDGELEHTIAQPPIQAPEASAFLNTPPIPEGGLPPGWTEDQWQHYGHQYVESEQTPGQ
jgi:hypothetical protein